MITQIIQKKPVHFNVLTKNQCRAVAISPGNPKLLPKWSDSVRLGGVADRNWTDVRPARPVLPAIRSTRPVLAIFGGPGVAKRRMCYPPVEAREDGGWHVRCPPWHICDPNLMNRWIDLRESVRLNRATETYIVSLWVHDFGLAKTRWVASRCPYSKRSFAPAHERLANDATTRTTNPHNRHTSMQE
jgi:hypothetical protein